MSQPARTPFTRLLLAAGAVALLLAGVACSGSNGDAVDQTAGGDFRFVSAQRGNQTIPLAKRKSAPDFTGTTLGGQKVTLSQYRGKVVALNFWASWCAPCRLEAPGVEGVYALFHQRGLQVLGVNSKDTEDGATSYVANQHLTYPSVFDPQGRVGLAFRHFPSSALPTTIVIDRHGRVAGAYITPLRPSQLQQIVTPLLAEK